MRNGLPLELPTRLEAAQGLLPGVPSEDSFQPGADFELGRAVRVARAAHPGPDQEERPLRPLFGAAPGHQHDPASRRTPVRRRTGALALHKFFSGNGTDMLSNIILTEYIIL